jgi:protoporphyrinogen oxidase
MKKVIILGGGLSGLAAAEILSKNFSVNLYESAPFVGGLASTFKINGKSIPMFYHHIIKSNKTTQKYLKEFGNITKLNWKKIKVAIGIEGKYNTVNSPLGLMKFKYLNLYEKFRFGLFGIYTLLFMNPDKIPESLDAQVWLEKYAGKAVTKKIFYNLYARNKFNIPLSRISAKQFANRLYEKEIQDYFSFPTQSYQPMIDNLVKSIKTNKGIVKLNSKIKKIDLKNKFIIESGKKIKYDILINTIPFEVFLKLARGLPKSLSSDLEKIKYCSGVGLCFSTKDFLDKDNYWINLFNERIHIIMQHSILCDTYGEKITWCLKYGGSEEDLNLSDKEIEKEYLSIVKKYFPKAEINWVKVMKTRFAEPIYDINYAKYMPPYKTTVPGLYFAGIQLTYPKIRNMNVALESGEKVAKIILEDFIVKK